MTAPTCPVHELPGRYIIGRMVTCIRCDAEAKAERSPILVSRPLTSLSLPAVSLDLSNVPQLLVVPNQRWQPPLGLVLPSSLMSPVHRASHFSALTGYRFTTMTIVRDDSIPLMGSEQAFENWILMAVLPRRHPGVRPFTIKSLRVTNAGGVLVKTQVMT